MEILKTFSNVPAPAESILTKLTNKNKQRYLCSVGALNKEAFGKDLVNKLLWVDAWLPLTKLCTVRMYSTCMQAIILNKQG